MRVKRLIVNADDLGLTAAVNRAIVDAHRRGVVTSATLMANGAAFDDAVERARTVPSLAVGCHVDVIQLAPVLPSGRVQSLVANGRFKPGLAKFAAAVVRGAVSASEITAEAAAQIHRLQTAGISVSHFDTHKHTHIFPPVLNAMVVAAKACGVMAVRNPFEPYSTIPLARAVRGSGLLSRWVAVRSMAAMARQFRRRVEREGLCTTDGTVGIAATGHLDQALLIEIVRRLPEGTWELVTHPGYADPELSGLSKLTASREIELAVLTAQETRAAITNAGVHLVSYATLAGER